MLQGKALKTRKKRSIQSRDEYLVSDNALSTDYFNGNGIFCFYCGSGFEEFEEELQCSKCKRYAHLTCARMSRSKFNKISKDGLNWFCKQKHGCLRR